MGKAKIAEHLARKGLHLAVTTVGRMLKEEPVGPASSAAAEVTGEEDAPRSIIARFPNSVWGIDLTLVPIVGGLWTCWMPFSLPQCWPFAWWVLAVVDHFSRRAMGVEVFAKRPTSENVTGFLNKVIIRLGRAPKYTVTDQGKQFRCDNYREWCHPHTLPRYGAVGKYGSIGVVERFIRSLKDECSRRLTVPLDIARMRAEVEVYAAWFNAERPHEFLEGRTPDETYFGIEPANEAPRWEPRARWPRRSKCASPQVPVRGPTGVKLQLVVDYHAGRRHLPIVRLKRAA
jgi:putative transposase